MLQKFTRRGRSYKVLIDFKHRFDATGIESAQPAPQGVPTRQPGKPAQPLHQRIDCQIAHVPHPPGARYQHRQPDRTKIAPWQGPFNAPQGDAKIQVPEKSPDQLQTCK